MNKLSILRALKPSARTIARTLVAIGAVAMSVSVAAIYSPAGGLLAGVLLVAYGLLMVDVRSR